MGEVVNLRRARKGAERRAKEAKAAANRASHGMPKADRAHAEAQVALERRRLDGHHRTNGDAKPREG